VVLIYITTAQVNKLHQSCLHSKLLPDHHAPTKHNKLESFEVAYLVKPAGGDLELSEKAMFPKKIR